eukprot:2305027-Prymnesium_polylepis.1
MSPLSSQPQRVPRCRALEPGPDQLRPHDLISIEAPGWRAQYLVKHNPLVVKFSEPVVLSTLV